MATHSNILAWEIHRQRSLAGYGPRGHERVGHDLATEQQCFPEPSFLHFNFLIIDYSLVLFLLLSYKLLNAIGPLSVFSSPCLTPTCLAVGHLEVESVPPLEQLHSNSFSFSWPRAVSCHNPVGQSLEASYSQGNICNCLDLI